MKKYFVVSDVHGFYDEMMEALNKTGWEQDNPNHIFVSLGDLLDRGRQPLQCLQFVNALPEDRKILIFGNHELLLDELIHRGTWFSYDKSNGTLNTVFDVTDVYNDVSYALDLMIENSEWRKYYLSLYSHAVIGNNIFVHGWIPSLDYENASLIDWKSATWQNGMRLWSQGEFIPGKTIWCGHWHTSWGHANLHHYGVEFLEDDWKYHKADTQGNFECFDPFIDKGIVAMDACTVYSHKVNCLSFEN